MPVCLRYAVRAKCRVQVAKLYLPNPNQWIDGESLHPLDSFLTAGVTCCAPDRAVLAG